MMDPTRPGIAKRLLRTYGAAGLPRNAGVLHVTAVWPSPSGARLTIRINEHAPKSADDLFALGLARARADAIITTGKILRDEPQLRYDLPAPFEPELRALREDLGRPSPPVVYVLTSGRDLDLDHPTFRSWATPVIYTGPAGGRALAEEAARRGIELRTTEAPDATQLVERLSPMGTVSVEAGPTTTAKLYAANAIDEVMLSEFLGSELAEDARGGPFPGDLGAFPNVEAGSPIDGWVFSRRRRDAPEPA